MPACERLTRSQTPAIHVFTNDIGGVALELVADADHLRWLGQFQSQWVVTVWRDEPTGVTDNGDLERAPLNDRRPFDGVTSCVSYDDREEAIAAWTSIVWLLRDRLDGRPEEDEQ
jgi:hypothetical protein